MPVSPAWPRWVAVLVPCALATGCLHVPRPDLGPDRVVDRGVAVALGRADGPELDWDFGDGTTGRGAEVRHVYGTTGRFTTRALEGTTERGRVTFEVVPRSVTRAIPDVANGAVFLPCIASDLDRTVDFVERLLGADALQRFLETALVPSIALERSAGGPFLAKAVARDEGIGFFTLPDFQGLVELIGAIDAEAVTGALLQRLSAKGGVPSQQPDGSIWVEMGEGREVSLFTDRGYVFMAIPDPTGSSPGSGVASAIVTIRHSSDGGLEKGGEWHSLAEAVARGNAYVYFAVRSEKGPPIDAVFASARLSQSTGELDGIVHGPAPLWETRTTSGTTLFKEAPQGWVAAATASVPAGQLGPLLRLLSFQKELGLGGVTANDLQALGEALAGDLGLLVYFDAAGFLERVAQSGLQVAPMGGVRLRAGVRDPGAVETWLRKFSRLPAGATALSSTELNLQIGNSPVGRPGVDASKALRERFGENAFGAGHVSAMVDVSELLREIEAPEFLRGIAPGRASMIEGFAAAFVRQLTSIDVGLVDLSPDPGGARLRVLVRLRAGR